MNKAEKSSTPSGIGVKAFGWPTARRLNPKKLLLSKWTAVTPHDKEKHFIVTGVIEPEPRPRESSASNWKPCTLAGFVRCRGVI